MGKYMYIGFRRSHFLIKRKLLASEAVLFDIIHMIVPVKVMQVWEQF